MTDERSNNEKAFDRFRERLTKGFYVVDPEGGEVIEDEEAHDRALRATKPWRNEIWKALNELERKTCPFTAMKQDKIRHRG